LHFISIDSINITCSMMFDRRLRGRFHRIIGRREPIAVLPTQEATLDLY